MSQNKSVAVQKKKLIREAEIRVLEIAVPFVTPDIDVVLKSLI